VNDSVGNDGDVVPPERRSIKGEKLRRVVWGSDGKVEVVKELRW
jgi:hypothetical protein